MILFMKLLNPFFQKPDPVFCLRPAVRIRGYRNIRSIDRDPCQFHMIKRIGIVGRQCFHFIEIAAPAAKIFRIQIRKSK